MAKKNTYVFNSKEIKRCIHHAVSSTNWTRWSDAKYNNRPSDKLEFAALVVMQDYSGVYIMSAGQPRDRFKNKKIYSAYAKGVNNNPKEHLRNGAVGLSNVNDKPYRRFTCLGVIYLSVGENGHVYEEFLTDVHEEFVVEITPATEEEITVYAQHLSRNAAQKITAIEMNSESDFQNTATNRRVMPNETTAAANNQ